MWKSFDTSYAAPRPAAVAEYSPRLRYVSHNIESPRRVTDTLFSNDRSQTVLFGRRDENDRMFDRYVGLPFMKGMTSRSTGETLLIGSDLHHIDVGPLVYAGVRRIGERKEYGDTIRWFNVGDTHDGFIGLDYNPNATLTGGVARNRPDVSLLANALVSLGFFPRKKIFLLQSPYLRECATGKENRTLGLECLCDWAM